MERQYIVILLVLFAGLNTQAQINVLMPADTTLHIGLNTYVQPMSLVLATTVSQQEYRHYLRTAKTLKILGWTSLGVGIPTMFFGLLITAVENRDGPYDQHRCCCSFLWSCTYCCQYPTFYSFTSL